MEFEWFEPKRAKTLAERNLDFADADLLFQAPYLVETARTVDGETRWLAVGMIAGLHVAVVFTRRGTTIRITSMRRARDGERRRYQALFGR